MYVPLNPVNLASSFRRVNANCMRVADSVKAAIKTACLDCDRVFFVIAITRLS